MTKTTPYSKAVTMDEGAFYNGLPVQWDEEHSWCYYVPKSLAECKYRDLIASDDLYEFDEKWYREDAEADYGPDGLIEDPEHYEYLIKQIPWYQEHYEFTLRWGWCLNKENGRYCIPITTEQIFEWAGLDPDDCIHEDGAGGIE